MKPTMNPTTLLLAAAALLGLLALAPSAARADSIELAKRHFKLGEEMFNRADYAGAMVQFQAAYKYSKKPALLFNVGRCQESLGQHAEAIKTYETYLESSPADSEQVKARIENLRRLVEQKAPPTPTPTPTPPTPAPAPSAAPTESTGAPGPEAGPGEAPATGEQPAGSGDQGSPLWGWVTAGAGGALLVTGVVLGALASAKATEMEEGYRDGKEYGDLQSTADAGESLQTGQIVTLVAGGVALAAGAVLLYMHYGRSAGSKDQAPKEAEDDLASLWIAPAVTPGGAFLGGGFSF